MLVETLLNILSEPDVEIMIFIAQQNVYVIHSPQEIIALYQSALTSFVPPVQGMYHYSLWLCHVPERWLSLVFASGTWWS